MWGAPQRVGQEEEDTVAGSLGRVWRGIQEALYNAYVVWSLWNMGSTVYQQRARNPTLPEPRWRHSDGVTPFPPPTTPLAESWWRFCQAANLVRSCRAQLSRSRFFAIFFAFLPDLHLAACLCWRAAHAISPSLSACCLPGFG